MTARLERLAALAADVPANFAIVELGVNTGKSTIAMAKATKAHVYSIDLWDMRLPSKTREDWRDSRGFTASAVFHQFLQAIETAGVAERVTWIKGDTHQIGKAWSRPIALLHIDAAHDAVSVRRDYDAWAKHILTNGWLCMDDAQHPDKVGRVISTVVKPSGLWSEYEMVDDRLFVARRVK